MPTPFYEDPQTKSLAAASDQSFPSQPIGYNRIEGQGPLIAQIMPASAESKPMIMVAPAVGTVRVGLALAPLAAPTLGADGGTITTTLTVYINGVAKSSGYVPVTGDVGQDIFVRQSSTNAKGTTTRDSATGKVPAVDAAAPAPAPSPAPSPSPSPAPSPAPAPAPAPSVSTKPRFAVGAANASLASLFAAATEYGTDGQREGTATFSLSSGEYGFLFLPQTDASGVRIQGPAGDYGGWSGYGSSGVFSGVTEDPVTTHGTFTDTASGTVYWVLRTDNPGPAPSTAYSVQ